MNDTLIDIAAWYFGDYGVITLSVLLLAIPHLITLRTIYQQNKLKRSDYVIQSYRQFMDDPMMLDLFYRIDYNNLSAQQLYFGCQDEKALDKLLGHFNSIGRLFREKILTMKDADFISYHTLRIYRNEAVQSYLRQIKEYNEQHRSYEDFEWFAGAVEKRMKSPASAAIWNKYFLKMKKTRYNAPSPVIPSV